MYTYIDLDTFQVKVDKGNKILTFIGSSPKEELFRLKFEDIYISSPGVDERSYDVDVTFRAYFIDCK